MRELERELEIGREIQRGFLPDSLPQPPGWEIASAFHPARQVGGDFYDAFPLADGRIALAVADVCDKGVGAALFMALFRSLLRSHAELHGQGSPAAGACHQRRRADERLHRPHARPLEHVRDDLLRNPRSGHGGPDLGQRRPRAAGRAARVGRSRASLPDRPGRRPDAGVVVRRAVHDTGSRRPAPRPDGRRHRRARADGRLLRRGPAAGNPRGVFSGRAGAAARESSRASEPIEGRPNAPTT